MTRSTHLHRLVAGLALAIAVAAVPLAGSAGAGPSEPDVPSTIRVEDGHKVFLVGHAVGVQIYSCSLTPSGPRWGFVAPRANLYGNNGQLIMTHFGGPSWQAMDGSTVRATRVDGVDVPGTIQWLLLKVSSRTVGADGDRLWPTTFIQRLNTAGGVIPPADTCTTASIGDVQEVPYTADYYFWKVQS